MGDSNQQNKMTLLYNTKPQKRCGQSVVEAQRRNNEVFVRRRRDFIELLAFSIFKDTKTCYAVYVGLELLASSNPPASASQSAGIIDMNY